MDDDEDAFNPEAIIQQMRAQAVRTKGPAKKNVVHEPVRQQAWPHYDEVATAAAWAGGIGNDQTAVFQDVISQMERDIERLSAANKELIKENRSLREDKSKLEEELESQKQKSGEALAKLRIRVDKLTKQLQRAQAAAAMTAQKDMTISRQTATTSPSHQPRSNRQQHNTEPERGFLRATVSDTMRRTQNDQDAPFERFLRRGQAPLTPAPPASNAATASVAASSELNPSQRNRSSRPVEKRRPPDDSDDSIPVLEIDLQALCTPHRA